MLLVTCHHCWSAEPVSFGVNIDIDCQKVTSKPAATDNQNDTLFDNRINDKIKPTMKAKARVVIKDGAGFTHEAFSIDHIATASVKKANPTAISFRKYVLPN